ncbi:unnamed protein product [Cuscuta campestris]|uniref:Protein kinase domain-containing protein n=1 Tax=Cuscuta campestris TaxID=132261 RepID=A0A484NDN0_9ASTE|nr:unnamed protein product [Cuscuta campestris]
MWSLLDGLAHLIDFGRVSVLNNVDCGVEGVYSRPDSERKYLCKLARVNKRDPVYKIGVLIFHLITDRHLALGQVLRAGKGNHDWNNHFDVVRAGVDLNEVQANNLINLDLDCIFAADTSDDPISLEAVIHRLNELPE